MFSEFFSFQLSLSCPCLIFFFHDKGVLIHFDVYGSVDTGQWKKQVLKYF